MDNDQYFGKNVQRLRGDLSQEALARRMRDRGWKWSQATVWSIEKGDRPLKAAEVLDLSEELDCLTSDLLAVGQEAADARASELLARLDDLYAQLNATLIQAENVRHEAYCFLADNVDRLSGDLATRLERRYESFRDLQSSEDVD